jgi:hypothetical protein
MSKTKTKTKTKGNKHSISVSGRTYDRIRAAVGRGGVAGLVDDAVASALDDPSVAAGVVARCRGEEACS